MTYKNPIKTLITHIGLAFSPNEADFRAGLTHDNALTKLQHYNDNKYLIRYAESASFKQRDLPYHRWLLNSFHLAAEITTPKHILPMAEYLNHDRVFTKTAPHYYTNTTWTQILSPMFKRAAEEQRPDLLLKLEENGHLQGIAKNHQFFLGPKFYFDLVAGHLDEQEAREVFARSQSFALAKKNPPFKLDVQGHYPQYGDMLT